MENPMNLPVEEVTKTSQEGFRLNVGIFVAMYLSETGRNKPALALFHECVELSKLIPRADFRDILQLSLYARISAANLDIGDLSSATEYLKLRVELQEKRQTILSDKCDLWASHVHLGKLYYHTGDFIKAIESLEKALGYARDSFQKGQACIDLSKTYLSLSNTDKATEYIKQAEDILKEGKTPQLKTKRNYFHVKGMLHSYTGHHKEALICYKKELLISRALGDKTEYTAYNLLAQTCYRMSDPKTALKMALKTVEKLQGIEAVQYLGDLPSQRERHLIFGFIREKAKDFKGAITCYEQGIGICEEIEQRLGEKDDYKVSISEIHHNFFLVLTRALIRDGQKPRALLTADRGRTRALADLMTSNYGVKAADVSHVKRLSIKEIQQMASRKSAFIMTAIGMFRVYLWHLASDGRITFREIPLLPETSEKNHIQSIVDMYYKELLGEEHKNRAEKCEDRSLGDVKWEVIREEIRNADSSLEQQEPLETTGSPMRVLYNLIAPIVDLLDQGNGEDATEELVFAPDGPLCLVPFSALQGPDGKRLIEKYRIRVIPSFTALNQILSSPANYHSKTGALIVGDPDVGNVQYGGEMIYIGRLPCAKKEAKMIGKFLKVKPLTGDEATKREVLNRLTSVSLVHLAAHGNSNGEIALAPEPSARSGTIEEKDYLLSMADVQSVKLRAKLVVLSCCHSGQGDIKPEGVVGIARAFLGAGARSVLVSLWAIGDDATECFMSYFYEYLVRGASASVALHQATKKLKNSEEFGKVRNWAPFMLIGDDVKISN